MCRINFWQKKERKKERKKEIIRYAANTTLFGGHNDSCLLRIRVMGFNA
jgi:hypothetical protein